MRRLTHLLVLVAFIFSCGGQWAVLQGVAWAAMIHEYAQVVPLHEAVTMTFSGKYPCALCKAIAEKKQSENSKALHLGNYEKKFLSPTVTGLITLVPSAVVYPSLTISFRSRSETPPTPPPRRVLS